MKGRSKRALGIDIGPGRVSMALVERANDALNVVHAASARIEEPGAVLQTLRRLRRQGRIPKGSAVMGISISPLVLQILDMPRQMPQNVREFVEGELGQYVTLSGKTIVCDFCAVGAGRDSQKRLLSAAGEIESIRDLVDACAVAGLNVQGVEPSILAYVRAREARHRIGVYSNAVLVIEVTADQLSACLLRRGALDFVRTKNLPAEAKTPQAANAWLIDEIVTMMRHCDPESSGTGAGWEMDVLIRDGAPVTRAIAEPIRVSTGVLPQILAEADEPARAGGDVAASRPEPGDAGTCTTAAGLAMRLLNARNDPWKIDLLPGDVTQVRGFTRHMLITATVAAVVFLGMISSLLLVARTADKTRRGLDRQRSAERLYLTPVLAEENRIVDQRLAQAHRQAQAITKAFEERNRVNWASVLGTVIEKMPAGTCCVTRLSSQDARHLTIDGIAVSGGAVRSLAQALGANELFEEVALGQMESRPGDKSLIRYEMNCLLRTSQ